MKFTNGYWLVKDEIEPVYAVEYYEHKITDKGLTVYVATNHVEGRGDILNRPLLTVTFSSPMPDVIRVSAVHFAGAVEKGPFFELFPEEGEEDFISVAEEQDKLVFTSGETSAVIDKRPNAWSVRFVRGGKLLTETSWRNMAYMKNKETGKNYMLEQLLLDVGESVYGFGERYTNFVKNGQEIEIWNEGI